VRSSVTGESLIWVDESPTTLDKIRQDSYEDGIAVPAKLGKIFEELSIETTL
jgi:hypothetical protein